MSVGNFLVGKIPSANRTGAHGQEGSRVRSEAKDPAEVRCRGFGCKGGIGARGMVVESILDMSMGEQMAIGLEVIG
ncbi:MAG: hypothetical protein QXP73_06270 [Candidatus Methanomethylicaceae archaeon]|nr:hypothetical protein [Candidatus Verstraetearchaeota archaeon]